MTTTKAKTKFVTIQILMGFMAHNTSKQRKIKPFSTHNKRKLWDSRKTPSQLTFDTHHWHKGKLFYVRKVCWYYIVSILSLSYIAAAHCIVAMLTQIQCKIGGPVHSKWNKVEMASFYFECIKRFPCTNKMLSKNVSCSSVLQYKYTVKNLATFDDIRPALSNLLYVYCSFACLLWFFFWSWWNVRSR